MARMVRHAALEAPPRPATGRASALRFVPAGWTRRGRTVADHLERHAGDYQAFWFGPLQSLCASCHSSRKQQAERVGYHYGCDVRGHPLDPNHPWNRGG